jgi:hypothetical protein
VPGRKTRIGMQALHVFPGESGMAGRELRIGQPLLHSFTSPLRVFRGKVRIRMQPFQPRAGGSPVLRREFGIDVTLFHAHRQFSASLVGESVYTLHSSVPVITD